MLSCMSCLYVLEPGPRQSHICEYFSPLLGCVSVSFMVSFVVQKLINLIRSHLFILASVSAALGDCNVLGFNGFCHVWFIDLVW